MAAKDMLVPVNGRGIVSPTSRATASADIDARAALRRPPGRRRGAAGQRRLRRRGAARPATTANDRQLQRAGRRDRGLRAGGADCRGGGAVRAPLHGHRRLHARRLARRHPRAGARGEPGAPLDGRRERHAPSAWGQGARSGPDTEPDGAARAPAGLSLPRITLKICSLLLLAMLSLSPALVVVIQRLPSSAGSTVRMRPVRAREQLLDVGQRVAADDLPVQRACPRSAGDVEHVAHDGDAAAGPIGRRIRVSSGAM